MAINVSFYNTSSDPRMINKKLTLVSSLNCDLLDSTDITKPVILTGNPAALHNVNYMYIADFSRYYFVKTEIVNGSICKITGNCDVLMSFKSGVLATKILLDRTSNDNYNNLYLADEKIRKYAYERTQIKLFPNNVLNRDGYCVLITAGGAPAEP